MKHLQFVSSRCHFALGRGGEGSGLWVEETSASFGFMSLVGNLGGEQGLWYKQTPCVYIKMWGSSYLFVFLRSTIARVMRFIVLLCSIVNSWCNSIFKELFKHIFIVNMYNYYLLLVILFIFYLIEFYILHETGYFLFLMKLKKIIVIRVLKWS